MMNVYNYGQEWNKNPWTKINFTELPQSGFTNEGEYGTVSCILNRDNPNRVKYPRKIEEGSLDETTRTFALQTIPPSYDFGALKVPFSLFYVNNDVFTGHQTALEVIAELNATDYKFIDGNNLTHLDAIVGLDTRCWTLNDILTKFEGSENQRDSAHKNYRSKVAAFVNSLSFQDGCVNAGP